MKTINNAFLTLALGLCTVGCHQVDDTNFFRPYKSIDLRLPSVPIIVNDPYLSIWSPYDNLNDGVTKHWTEQEKPLEGMLRVDGVTYQFLGSSEQREYETIVPMANETDWEATYTTDTPYEGWQHPDFNDRAWKRGKGAFGGGNNPIIRTKWSGENSDIYIRRTVELTAADLKGDLYAILSHDDGCEFFINGILVSRGSIDISTKDEIHLNGEKKQLLHEGKNLLAYHVINYKWNSYADLGIYRNIATPDSSIQKAEQLSVDVLATSSYYTFRCGPVELDVVFTAPMLIDDLDLLSTPINYISYQVRPNDGQAHDVQFFLSATPQMGQRDIKQPTLSTKENHQGIDYLKTGTISQPILASKGDGICIDWGYFYLPAFNGQVSLQKENVIKDSFLSAGTLPATLKEVKTYDPSDAPKLAYVHDFGDISSPASSYTLVGYDEILDVEYMYQRYKGYWAHHGEISIFDAFSKLSANYASIMKQCRQMDKRIYDDGLKAGNQHYAEILSGSYRQVMAAHKLFEDNEGNLLYFSKENSSNGCINTVDLTYPSSPLYLVYNPNLLKAMLTSIIEYSKSGRWTKPFAPHDLGRYPIANGQDYGGDMPLEEAGNMLILTATLCQIDGNTKYIDPYWDIITTWTDYLVENGQDPDNQLCTDDFAGHWAHNCNLGIKAILGIAGYAEMAKMKGEQTTADKYLSQAKRMAEIWEQDAREDDHYRLAFDRENTWGQKYNLIWDKLWQTNIFPSDVTNKEISYYLTKQNRYGLPLDLRRDYTKSDWIMWCAAMAEDNDTFFKLMEPVYSFINETHSRVPISDRHYTTTGNMQGFKARSVIGGYWMKVLAETNRIYTVDAVH